MPQVHATEDFMVRSNIVQMNKANIPSILLPPPAVPALTPATSGGSLADGTYTYRFTSLDADGNESPLSASVNGVVSGGSGSGSIAVAAGTVITGSPRTGNSVRAYRTLSGSTVYYNLSVATFAAGYTDTGATTYAGTATTVVPLNTTGQLAKYAYLNNQTIDTLSTATVAGLKTQNNTYIGSVTAAPVVHESEINYIRQFNNGLQKMSDMYLPDGTTSVLSSANVASAKGASAGAEFTTLRTGLTADLNDTNYSATTDAGEQAMVS